MQNKYVHDKYSYTEFIFLKLKRFQIQHRNSFHATFMWVILIACDPYISAVTFKNHRYQYARLSNIFLPSQKQIGSFCLH